MISFLKVLSLLYFTQILIIEGYRIFPSLHRIGRKTNIGMSSIDGQPKVIRGKKWPGDRPPCSNPMLEGLRMDATWGRGKLRDEIWEDKLSPNGEWWRAYLPTDEEIEAMELGYDFSEPRKWHEERGLDFDAAWAETQRLMKDSYAKYVEERNEMIRMLKQTPERFLELKEKRQKIIASHNNSHDTKDYSDEEIAFLEYFYELKCTKEELEYRKLDDERQRMKGQQSLEFENTGAEFLKSKQ